MLRILHHNEPTKRVETTFPVTAYRNFIALELKSLFLIFLRRLEMDLLAQYPSNYNQVDDQLSSKKIEADVDTT